MKRIKQMILKNKTLVVILVLAFVAVVSASAQANGTIDKLDEWSNNLLALFTGSWIKALLLIALACEAIGVVVAGQQGGGGAMVKKFAPWIVGTVILLCASSITGYFTKGMEFSVDSHAPVEKEASLAMAGIPFNSVEIKSMV